MQQDAPSATTTVYDVASGQPVTVPGSQYDVGWTADGDLFERRPDPDVLTTCVVITGECSVRQLDLEVAPDAGYQTRTVDDDLVLGGAHPGVVTSLGESSAGAGGPSASSALKPSSSRTGTPSCSALSALVPALSPTTT